jgi:N-formylglutamate amidohydrolase
MLSARVPLVIHVPHSATALPPEALADFVCPRADLDRFVAQITDHFTDDLFSCHGRGDAVVRFPISRVALDPERFDDDAREPMAARGYGVLYERGVRTEVIRPALGADRRAWMLERWYGPHHQRLAEAVNGALRDAGCVLIIDAHSFPDEPMAFDLDQRTPRPDACIGTCGVHTPGALVDAARWFCEREGWTLGVDWPYAGTIVPMEHLEREARVMSVMVEINRRRYMRLEGDDAVRTDEYERTRRFVAGLVEMLRAAAGGVTRQR